jgi:flavin-dependent dehydrogenase
LKSEVTIIGGGPGGSTLAMYLIRLGIKPVIIEKETFPRFHIGESMTGECGRIVRDLGLGDELVRRKNPVKHGVKVYGKHPWWLPVMLRAEDGQLKDQTTWQVKRSEFDKMLLSAAVERGAILLHGQATDPIVDEDGVVKGVGVHMADGGYQRIESEMLVDCSGQATFLATKGVAGPKYLGSYDKQIAIFSHFVGGIRDEGDTRDLKNGNTFIYYRGKYQWAWWIPITDEVTSVGVVTPAAYFMEKGMSKKDYLAREVHAIHPDLTARLPEINMVEDVRVIKNYSYQVNNFSGKGFLCIGDAHRFIDPIFSFGLYVTMKEAQFAAPLIKEYIEGKRRDAKNPFAEHQIKVERGIDVLEDCLDSFWEHPFAFAMLVYQRHFENMVDVFAGKIYDAHESKAVQAFRGLLKRERNYGETDQFSIPIGSRYHPERAPIWVEDSSDLQKLQEILEL